MVDQIVILAARVLKTAIFAVASLTSAPEPAEEALRLAPSHVPGVHPLCPGMMLLVQSRAGNPDGSAPTACLPRVKT